VAAGAIRLIRGQSAAELRTIAHDLATHVKGGPSTTLRRASKKAQRDTAEQAPLLAGHVHHWSHPN